jgi:uncharacterized RDD family membrane protein YckC
VTRCLAFGDAVWNELPMQNCVECGAPLGGAGESCGACGAQAPSETTNGTQHPFLEGPDGVAGDEPPLLRDLERPGHREHQDPSFVHAPLHDDPAVETPAFATAPVVDAAPEPAPVLSRAIALLIDFAVLSFLDGVLFTLATGAVLLAEQLTGARVGDAVNLVRDSVSAGSLTLMVGYFSVLHARSGQTLGKIALRIHVAAPDGGRIGMARSVLRTLGYALSALPFLAGFLIALGPSGRALHDRIADTVVLRGEAPS